MAPYSGIISLRTSYWIDVIDDGNFSLQESYDQLFYENLKLNKIMTKINNSLKEKDKEHLKVFGQFLNLILEGERDMDNLKMRLDNHNNSIQILLHDNEKCLTLSMSSRILFRVRI